MKRYFAIILAVTLILSLAACGGSGTSSGSSAAAQEASSAPEDSTSAEAETDQEPASAEAEEAGTESVSDDEGTEASVEETEYSTVAYPIEGGYTLNMLVCRRNDAINALGDDDYTAQYLYPELVERTGIEMTFKMLAEATYTEQTNLIISSQDYPDIFGSGVGSYDNNYIAGIADGVILDMTDLMEENAPDYLRVLDSHPDWASNVYNGDGSICLFESCKIGVQSQGLVLRGDWMEEQGLEVPSTIEDFTEVLKKLQNAYDTPMTLLVSSDLGDGLSRAFDHADVGYEFNMLGFQLDAPGSDKVVCAVATKGYYEHLTLLREYFETGLINSDFLGISKGLGTFESSYYSGTCAAWYDGAGPLDNTNNADDSNWSPMAIPMLNGDTTHMTSFTEYISEQPQAVISGACENPEIAMQFLNYGYTEEGQNFIQFGIEDDTFIRNDDGTVEYTDMIANYAEGGLRTAEWVFLVKSWMPYEQTEEGTYMGYKANAVAACKLWTEDARNADGSMTLPTGLSLNEDELEVYNSHMTDVSTYIGEMASKYVIGEVSGEEFQQAVSEASAMGLDEVTEAYQSAYDRFMAA